MSNENPTILELVDKKEATTRLICNEEHTLLCTKNRIASLKVEADCLRKDIIKQVQRLVDGVIVKQ